LAVILEVVKKSRVIKDEKTNTKKGHVVCPAFPSYCISPEAVITVTWYILMFYVSRGLDGDYAFQFARIVCLQFLNARKFGPWFTVNTST
ncbi:hypothetical protein BgiBS90_032280, partial [Biomphalaria glabrata]